MRLVFNPFGKPFKDITEGNLSILKTISEGWYALIAIFSFLYGKYFKEDMTKYEKGIKK